MALLRARVKKKIISLKSILLYIYTVVKRYETKRGHTGPDNTNSHSKIEQGSEEVAPEDIRLVHI